MPHNLGMSMKKSIFLLLFCLLSLTTAHASEENIIRDTLTKYQNALLESKGDTACSLLTKNSLDDYTRAKSAALTMPSEKLSKLPMIEQILAVRLRLSLPFAELSELSALKICEFGVNNGLTSKDPLSKLKMGKLSLSGTKARGNIISGGKELTGENYPAFYFELENSAWKVSLVEISRLAESGIKQVIKDSQMSQEEFLLFSLSSVTGRSVTADVFNLDRYRKGFLFQEKKDDVADLESLDKKLDEIEKQLPSD